MEYIEKRSITISVSDIKIEGIISGTNEEWEFSSSNEDFLKAYPDGTAWSTIVNPDDTRFMKDLHEVLTKAMKKLLEH